MWAAAAGLGLSMLGSYQSARAAEIQGRVQAANQYTQTLIGYQRELSGIQNALTQQGKRNEAIAKADLQSLINTNYTAGLLNLQRAMQKRQAAQEIQTLGETKLQALAQSGIGASATGTVGASVNAVAADVAMKIGEAKIATLEREDMNTMTLQTQIRNLYQGFLDSRELVDTTVPDIPGMPPQYGAVSVSPTSAALAGGLNYAGNYLTRYMGMMTSDAGLNISPFFSSSLGQTLNSSSITNTTASFSFK